MGEQVQVHGIGIDARWGQPLVLLQEVDGRGRILPVWVAETDAAAIVAAQSGVSNPRPDTHTLIRTVIGAFGHRLTGVVITAMRDNVYHAELVVDGTIRIDSRPSDALAIALRAGVDIQATDEVLDDAGVPPDAVLTNGSDDDPLPGSPVSESDVERFRRLLDDASPSDFEDRPDPPGHPG